MTFPSCSSAEASFPSFLLFASDSEPDVVAGSAFLGHVRALWPGKPQILHFLDILESMVKQPLELVAFSQKTVKTLALKGKKPNAKTRPSQTCFSKAAWNRPVGDTFGVTVFRAWNLAAVNKLRWLDAFVDICSFGLCLHLLWVTALRR